MPHSLLAAAVKPTQVHFIACTLKAPHVGPLHPLGLPHLLPVLIAVPIAL